MTTVDEKEILEIEKLKQEIQLNMKRFNTPKENLEIEKIKQDLRESALRIDKFLSDETREDLKIKYEAWRLAFYGVAVGLGGTFAIAKTISLMGW
jgi:hypothetical protein